MSVSLPNGRSLPARVDIRVLATSDIHAALFPFDFVADRQLPRRGLLSLRPTIEALRKENPNTLLVDNGDTLQGDMVASWAYRTNAPIHPVVEAINDLGYDAVTLGNHDLDFGLDFLEDAFDPARFVLITSNLTRSEDRRPLFCQSRIIPIKAIGEHAESVDVNVGILGVLPEKTIQWGASDVEYRVSTVPMIEAAKSTAANLRAEGADIILALAHTGKKSDGADNLGTEIAAIEEIDLVVCGHDHDFFPQQPTETNIVQPGHSGQCVGVLDAELEKCHSGWSVRRSSAFLSFPKDGTDIKLSPQQEATKSKVRAFACTQVGSITKEIDFDTALSRVSGAAMLFDDAVRWSLREHDPDVILQPYPILVATSPIQLGVGAPAIPAGPILRRHLHQLCPYQNELCLLEMDGAGVRDWVKRSADLFAINASKGPVSGAEAANFDCFADLDLVLETRVARQTCEVVKVLFRGTPLQDNDKFFVATSNFRASGGGGFPVHSAKILKRTQRGYQDILEAYLRAHPHYEPKTRDNLTFIEPAPI